MTCTCIDPTNPCPACEQRIDDGADWFFDRFDEGWATPPGDPR